MSSICFYFSNEQGQKDFSEKMGDACLSFGRKAFGGKEVVHLQNHKNDPTINKIEHSVGYIFLFLLLLPLTALISFIGMTAIALSSTHQKEYESIQAILQSKKSEKSQKPEDSVEIPIQDPPTTKDPQVQDPKAQEAKTQTERLNKWQEQFDQTVKSANNDFTTIRQELKKLRIPLYEETQRICEQGYYYLDDQQIHFDQATTQTMIAETVSCSLQNELPPLDRAPYHTIVEIVEEDTFDLAESYLKQGYQPIGLNLANKNVPGGGVKKGSGAQEESLFRRSNYYQALCNPSNRKTMYPIKPLTNVIYTPGVQVFRTRETDLTVSEEARLPSYQFRKPFAVDMIACAFHNLTKAKVLPVDYEAVTRDQIRNIFRVAYRTGHNALVLGAGGCGAFANDPRVISRLFQEELDSDEFRGRFQKVGFGIIYPDMQFKNRQTGAAAEELNLIDVFKHAFGQ